MENKIDDKNIMDHLIDKMSEDGVIDSIVESTDTSLYYNDYSDIKYDDLVLSDIPLINVMRMGEVVFVQPSDIQMIICKNRGLNNFKTFLYKTLAERFMKYNIYVIMKEDGLYIGDKRLVTVMSYVSPENSIHITFVNMQDSSALHSKYLNNNSRKVTGLSKYGITAEEIIAELTNIKAEYNRRTGG